MSNIHHAVSFERITAIAYDWHRKQNRTVSKSKHTAKTGSPYTSSSAELEVALEVEMLLVLSSFELSDEILDSWLSSNGLLEERFKVLGTVVVIDFFDGRSINVPNSYAPEASGTAIILLLHYISDTTRSDTRFYA